MKGLHISHPYILGFQSDVDPPIMGSCHRGHATCLPDTSPPLWGLSLVTCDNTDRISRCVEQRTYMKQPAGLLAHDQGSIHYDYYFNTNISTVFGQSIVLHTHMGKSVCRGLPWPRWSARPLSKQCPQPHPKPMLPGWSPSTAFSVCIRNESIPLNGHFFP